MELADLTLLEHPKNEGYTPCFSVVGLISNGKTNKFGKRQYGAAIRNKEPLLCTMGALALQFFYRWHCSGEKAPTFFIRNNWYQIKVLTTGSNPTTAMSFATQYDDTKEIFGALGVTGASVTHMPRIQGIQQAELNGVSESQVCYNSILQI
jgi:hypothetical protein